MYIHGCDKELMVFSQSETNYIAFNNTDYTTRLRPETSFFNQLKHFDHNNAVV